MKNNISVNNLCCGCSACEQICPKKAVTMQPDDEGFLYPRIEDALCIDCGLCTNVCPELHYIDTLNPTGKAFAMQANDFELLERSSSGGIFSVIARHVLLQVVGAELTTDLKVQHVLIERLEDLHKLQGSKYVQSDTNNIFKQVKIKLKEGKKVFFTGTPCQVSALKLFLHKPYDNLITSDLVCHGTPSPLMFKQLIDYLEQKYKGKVIAYQFRSKKMTGWSRVSACTMLINGKQKHIYYDEMMRAFFQAFLDGHVLRMDCYRCPFTKKERTGDLTMADFWSLNRTNPSFRRQHRGVSMILTNTDKAKEILEECSKEFYKESSDMGLIVSGLNYQLKRPTTLTDDRIGIFDFMSNQSDGFIRKYITKGVFADKRLFYITAIKEQIKKLVRFNGQY